MNQRLALCFEGTDRKIVISDGLVILLFDLFNRMLSHPDILPGVGNRGIEKAQFGMVHRCENAAALRERSFLTGRFMCEFVPKDRVRRLVAEYLGVVALDWVLAHEFRHHQAGHLEFAGGLSLLSLEETAVNDFDWEVAMKLQALEMDADAYGTKETLRGALNRFDNLHSEHPDWGLVLRSRRDCLLYCLLASYGLFKVLGAGALESPPWDAKQHPPRSLRQAMCFGTALECLRRWRPEGLDNETITLTSQEVIRECESGFALLSASVPNLGGLADASSPAGGKHIDKVLEYWSRVVPELKGMSYVDLD